MRLTLAPDSDYTGRPETSDGPEIDLLLACVRASLAPPGGSSGLDPLTSPGGSWGSGPLTSNTSDSLSGLLDGGVNWAQLIWLAYRHGVLPALGTALERASHPSVRPDIQQQLDTYSETNTRRNAEQIVELRRLGPLLDAAGAPALSFRASSQLPESPCGERESEPLDLLVSDQARQAASVLAAAGYQPLHGLSSRQTSAMQRARGAAVLHNHERGIRLHLWNRTTPISFAMGPSASHLWQRRRPASDGLLPMLSTEDLLISICVSSSFHLWNRLAWIADVARMLADRAIDWDRALLIADETHAERALLLGLSLAGRLLAAPVPDRLVARAAADPEIARLSGEVQNRLRRDLRGRLSELERSRFRLAVLARQQDRARYSLVFPLQPDLEDFNAVHLPDPAAPLYFAVRPVRLAVLLAGRALGRRTRAPFLPSPMPVVSRMLGMANVQPGDVVYDLGCGDGRIVIAAAQQGAHAVGVDLDSRLVTRARQNAQAAGVDHLTTFIEGDALDVDLKPATVVTLWTVPDLNLQLRPRLRSQLQPGARVVGHSFDMGDWAPDRTELIPNDDDVVVAYVWTIPGPLPETSAPDDSDGSGPQNPGGSRRSGPLTPGGSGGSGPLTPEDN